VKAQDSYLLFSPNSVPQRGTWEVGKWLS
jgi:hypothetical protein